MAFSVPHKIGGVGNLGSFQATNPSGSQNIDSSKQRGLMNVLKKLPPELLRRLGIKSLNEGGAVNFKNRGGVPSTLEELYTQVTRQNTSYTPYGGGEPRETPGGATNLPLAVGSLAAVPTLVGMATHGAIEEIPVENRRVDPKTGSVYGFNPNRGTITGDIKWEDASRYESIALGKDPATFDLANPTVGSSLVVSAQLGDTLNNFEGAKIGLTDTGFLVDPTADETNTVVTPDNINVVVNQFTDMGYSSKNAQALASEVQKNAGKKDFSVSNLLEGQWAEQMATQNNQPTIAEQLAKWDEQQFRFDDKYQNLMEETEARDAELIADHQKAIRDETLADRSVFGLPGYGSPLPDPDLEEYTGGIGTTRETPIETEIWQDPPYALSPISNQITQMNRADAHPFRGRTPEPPSLPPGIQPVTTARLGLDPVNTARSRANPSPSINPRGDRPFQIASEVPGFVADRGTVAPFSSAPKGQTSVDYFDAVPGVQSAALAAQGYDYSEEGKPDIVADRTWEGSQFDFGNLETTQEKDAAATREQARLDMDYYTFPQGDVEANKARAALNAAATRDQARADLNFTVPDSSFESWMYGAGDPGQQYEVETNAAAANQAAAQAIARNEMEANPTAAPPSQLISPVTPADWKEIGPYEAAKKDLARIGEALVYGLTNPSYPEGQWGDRIGQEGVLGVTGPAGGAHFGSLSDWGTALSRMSSPAGVHYGNPDDPNRPWGTGNLRPGEMGYVGEEVGTKTGGFFEDMTLQDLEEMTGGSGTDTDKDLEEMTGGSGTDFDSTGYSGGQGENDMYNAGGLASLPPVRYGWGGDVLSGIGRIGGTILLTPYLGPVGASAAASGAVSLLEGKNLGEAATSAAISGLLSYGTGEIFESDMLKDVGTDTVGAESQQVFGKDWGIENFHKSTTPNWPTREILPKEGLALKPGSVDIHADEIVAKFDPRDIPASYAPMQMRDLYRIGTEELGRQSMMPPKEEEIEEVKDDYRITRSPYRPRPRAPAGGPTFYNWKEGGAIQKFATGGGAGQGGIGNLTPGDFVISADVVADVGDGSSEYGAERIEEEFGLDDYEEAYNRAGVVNTGLSGMVKGPGSGLDDLIQTTIAGKRAARIANQEVVVPKQVVQAIGKGSQRKGQEKLYNFMDNVRKQKHGTTRQPTALRGSLESLLS